jgi:hypothetical protein
MALGRVSRCRRTLHCMQLIVMLCCSAIKSRPFSAVHTTDCPTGARQRVLPKAAIAEDGSFQIPDNLRLKPEDTEADKTRKRNKVKVRDRWLAKHVLRSILQKAR